MPYAKGDRYVLYFEHNASPANTLYAFCCHNASLIAVYAYFAKTPSISCISPFT